LRDSAAGYLTIGFACSDENERVRVQTEHDKIGSALATGTADQAAQAVRSHLDRSAQYLAGLIQAQTPEEQSALA
jgi:DNA-binding FadR family transcriptional regulator